MALNFPNSPVDGQIYYDPTSGAKYVWVAASSKWKSMQYSSTIVAFGYQTANAAYDTTNAAFAMANAAYNVQNVDFTLSNSAFTHANAAFDVANSALPNVSNAVFAGNLRITGNLQIGTNTVTIRDNHIISAEYYRMNTANHMVAIPDGNRVNTIFSLVNVSFDTANASYNSANNVGPQIAPTYNTANAAFGVVNTAYASINSNWTVTNALYSVANSAFASANNVGPQIAPTYNTANAAYNQANAAYNGSNAGYTTANAAFAFANTRFSSSGGTISGAVEITADLTVHGNTRFIDQQTLQVGDPLIYLAANNYTSDVVDIGFVANYVNATSANVHTGLFRSSGSKEYYLFQGYDKEPINNYIDPTGNNITMAVLNATVRTSNLILGGTNTINWITSGYVATNAAFGVANAAYGAANNVGPQIAPAYNTANAAFAKANNALPLAGGTLTGKPTISLDDASMAVAGSHLTINSPTLSQASLGFAFGGTGKASIRIDNGGSFVMNGAANTYYYGYDIVSGGAATSNFYTGSAYFMSAAGSAVTFPGSARSPIFYDSDNTGYYLDPASTTNISVLSMNSMIRRTDHAVGFLEGSYNNVGANDTKSNPIYTIGSSYNPTNTALSNMYGIGYTHSNFWSGKGGGWGLYVVSAGTIKGTFGCEADPNTWISGYGLATGSWRAPLFYDSDNTGYYTDPASTSVLNGVTAYGVIDNSPQTGYLRLPIGTTAQRPSPSTGMLRYNSSYNNLEMYNGSYWFNIGTSSTDMSAYDGSSSSLAALSAWDIKMLTGTNTDGVYWINLPTVGATQVYCLMDEKWAGGGWMMAMKATRGTTFNYGSTYWTAINTLNPTDNTRNDADAKYNTFNYYKGKDLLALWPDIGQGGMLQNTGCWSWVQNRFMSGAPTTLYNLFSTGNQVNLGSGRAYGGYGHGVFSSQGGWQWYGFNYQGNASYRVRWGFAWNNETDQSSNDVSGGIGMDRNSYSAGDYISAAQDITGMNRSARVEMYIR